MAKSTSDKVATWFAETAASAFIPPLWVMWGAQALHWGWGYWTSFFVESAVTTPLGVAAFVTARTVIRQRREWEQG